MSNLLKKAAASIKDAVTSGGTELIDNQRDKLTKDIEIAARKLSSALIVCGGLIAFGLIFHAVTLICIR